MGIFTIRQFGVPLDDYTQYVIGQENYHVLIGEQQIEKINPEIRYYGPVFETFCYTIDSMFYGEPEPIQKWGMRHAFIFFFFSLALWFFWKLCLLIFKSKKTAWILMLLMAIYPRIFADAHYNSKDTIFLCLLVFSLYPISLGIVENKAKWILWGFGLLGMACTIRLAGFFVFPAFTITLLLVPNKQLKIQSKLRFLAFAFSAMCLAFYIFFPALWKHPITEFITLVHRITNFPWPNETLVAANWVGPNNMPWWYFPVWYFITTPILYHVFLFISIIAFVKNRSIWFQNLPLVFSLLFLAITLSYIFFTTPNLYDSWRQLQFLFVPILLLCGVGVHYILQFAKMKWPLLVLLGYQFIVFLLWHPYQYVYFNEYYALFNKPNTYDQDYWQLSTRKALNWISNNDTAKSIQVFCPNSNSVWLNTFLKTKYDKTNFEVSKNRDSADYEIIPIRNPRFNVQTPTLTHAIVPFKDTICKIVKLK